MGRNYYFLILKYYLKIPINPQITLSLVPIPTYMDVDIQE